MPRPPDLPSGAEWLPNGRIRVRIAIPAGPGGRRQYVKKVVDTPAEARRLYAEVQNSVEEGTYIAPATDTVDSFLDGWEAAKAREVKPSTLTSYVVALKPVRRLLGARKLQSLTKADIEAVVTDILARGRTGRTANLTLLSIKAALTDARREGLIKSNPADLVKRVRESKPEMATWTAAQMQVFLDHIGEHPWRVGAELSCLGMRRAEVCGLRWQDIDLRGQTLSIVTTRVSIRGAVQDSTPKSQRSRRVLPLDGVPHVLEVLRRAHRDAGLLGRREGATVLVDEAGQPLRPERFGDWLQREMATAGVPVIRVHDLRHSFATIALGQGVPVHEVAAWLGHDASVLLRNYAHAIPSRLAGVAAAVRTAR